MGRRAKNKQAPPAPLDHQRPTKPTSKRKADALDDSAPFVKSVKKVKQVEIKSKRTGTGKPLSKRKKQEQSSAGKGKTKNARADDDDEEWEDMDDEEVDDLRALTKYVIPPSSVPAC
jgi:ribosomal RNA methyltransferase Nop2